MGVGDLNRRAVFLDRDGVINRNVLHLDQRESAIQEYGAPRTPEEFAFAPSAIEALLRLQQSGYLLFLVSNQPDYAKRKSTIEDLKAVHRLLESELVAAGVIFADFYYCYHHPHGVVPGYSGRCECRKPSPYFLLKAKEEFRLSLEESWMVGDRVADVECGRAAGLRTVRVAEDHPAHRSAGETQADFETHDLVDAAEIILKADSRPREELRG
jgi:D-glycero-D-manno-heptose 1,7-bisphosphate phosphatase